MNTSIRLITNLFFQKGLSLLNLPAFSLKIFWILTAISVGILLAFYVFQVNQIIQANYLISDYEKSIDKLSWENKNLEINFSQQNSLEDVGNLAESLDFEPIAKIYYIRTSDGTVAVK